ncbi:3791_t:CDS:10, partial [Acaulospora morrowiae]
MWSKLVGQLKNANPIFGASAPSPATSSLKQEKSHGRRSSIGSPKDPRATVARRKSSLLYGVVSEVEVLTQEKHEKLPRKIIPPEQQTELHSLFQLWQNSFNEQERVILLTATSRKFFETFFECPKMIEESLDNNLEIFTDAITRHLISNIGGVEVSASDILQKLADESQLFFIIKTINLLCDGPEVVYEVMSAHALPAILIKTFQRFVEIPTSNVGRDGKDASERMAPSDVVSDILTDILVNFVTYRSTLNQLLEQDLLYILVEMVITDKLVLNGGYNLWIERALEVLVELFACATQEVVSYFLNKDIMKTLMKILNDSIKIEENRFIDSGRLIYAGSLIIELILGTIHVSPIFLESFVNMNGYETFYHLLLLPPFDEKSSMTKDTLITMVEDLIFAGVEEFKPVASNGTPYQHSDFQLPAGNENDDETLFRNERALQVLISVLLYPEPTFSPDSKISSSIQLPDIFRQKIVVSIAGIFKSNNLNYFLMESLNILPTLIENLDKFSPKRSILDLLVFVMVDLNYVPFRELVVLSLHFQGQSLKHTTAIACETVTSLLQSSPKFKEVFREIGLLNMLCSLLQDLATTLQDKFGNTPFVKRISISNLSDIMNSQQNEISKAKSRFGHEVIDNFHLISECLVELLKGNKANLSLFGATYKGNLFDLLHYDETRDGALTIFETLVVEGHVLSNRAELQAPLEHSFQFGRLIEIVQSLSRFDLKMKKHILWSMKRILVSCPDMKDVFRETGGFVCLVSLLVGLEDVFKLLARSKDESDHSDNQGNVELLDVPRTEELPEMSQAIDTLKAIFLTFAEAVSNHETNRRFFNDSIGYKSIEDAIHLTDILKPTGSPEHLFGILFSFAVENETISEVFVDDVPNGGNVPHEIGPSKIIKMLGNLTDEICNPDIISTIMTLQLSVSYKPKLVLKIYEALLALSFANRRNQVMMNKSGVLEVVLRRLFLPSNTISCGDKSNDLISTQEKRFLTRLAQRLIEMGVSTTEIRFLFEQFENGNQQHTDETLETDGTLMTAMDMVLYGVQRSRWPRFVQFDMCQFGYSCLEMNNLTDKPFPPANGGYTFMTWIDIENFDPNVNLTLLGLRDEEDRCYLHIYIEARTHKLVIQTSPRQGVRFESFVFRTGCWYHIALVH